MCARVRDARYAGLTDAEIAYLLGINILTLKHWREEYPELEMAWKIGGMEADTRVAAALFKRCTGYTTVKRKKEFNLDGVLVKEIEEEVHVAPDVTAQIFWMKNRQPEHWQDRVEHAIPVGGTIIDSMSDVEVARRIAFALASGHHALIHGSTDDGTATSQSTSS